jgi:hypothetical protein
MTVTGTSTPSGPRVPDSDPRDAESLADLRLLAIVERYARLVQAQVERPEAHLLVLTLPQGEARHFRRGRSVTLAFSLPALERNPDAEMAVVGSAFLEDLLDAVRTRGFYRDFGRLPQRVAPAVNAVNLTVPTVGLTIGPPSIRVVEQAVGRLIARVAIKAGAVGEELIVESGYLDFTSGTPPSPELAALCGAVESGQEGSLPASTIAGESIDLVPSRSMEKLLPLLFGDLERQLQDQIKSRKADAERTLAGEIARLDRYYSDLLQEASEGGEDLSTRDRRAIELERDRRKTEEQRRYEVRVTVYPLQVVRFGAIVQRAEWQLSTSSGLKGFIAGQRLLSGDGAWTLACPTCGRSPRALRVCSQNHVTCGECSQLCGVCGEAFCEQHGIAACHVDSAPTCQTHARRCPACRREHCTQHEGECAEGGHRSCTACLAACAVCGRLVCTAHGVTTGPLAPKGSRRVCHQCVVYCEGAFNEPVGRDEAVRCATCDKSVCTSHRALCAVDHQVHCSKHLRRADRSRRLTCEQHRAQCNLEPHVIFVSDEIVSCASCGKAVCGEHSGVCRVDGERHCTTHLARMHDSGIDLGCEEHRSVCHVDHRSYTLTGTTPCPACGRLTCTEHYRTCKSCGRGICFSELSLTNPPCSTCRHLNAVVDPSDRLIAAAIAANHGEPLKGKTWRKATDDTHDVVEIDLGWSRRLVFAVRHSDTTPEFVMRHSLLGSSRVR